MLYQASDIAQNKRLFENWYNINSASHSNAYKKHAVDVLNSWLDEKLPGNDIGCLFRFENLAEFESKLEAIFKLDNFNHVDQSDQRGRPTAALNYYKRYLEADIYNKQTQTNNPKSEPIINCMADLIDLVLGEASTTLTEDEKIHRFADYMISKTYFFSPEIVNNRHKEILEIISQNEKLKARFSTAKNIYFEENGYPAHLTSRNQAAAASKERNIYYKSKDRRHPILIDTTGNNEVVNLIKDYSSARISQGNKYCNIKSVVISHIWGYAYDPIFFTNLWNIAIVPNYLNPVLDKTENNDSTYYDKTVRYVKLYYKNYLYKLYDMEAKIEDYKKLGIDISEMCKFYPSVPIELSIPLNYLDEIFN